MMSLPRVPPILAVDSVLRSRLLRQALRLTRHRADADDLVQETLLAAIRAERCDPAWLHGVLVRQHALRVRGEHRRHGREATQREISEQATEADSAETADSRTLDPVLLAALPPSARQVLRLAWHGLDAREICHLLGLAPTAFRQRLSSLRRVLATLPPARQRQLRDLASTHTPARSSTLPLGLMRRSLKAAVSVSGTFGSHDPDGHLLLVHGRAHTFPPGGNSG